MYIIDFQSLYKYVKNKKKKLDKFPIAGLPRAGVGIGLIFTSLLNPTYCDSGWNHIGKKN